MLARKRLTSSFFTSILLCIGVFGVLQLFVLEDGVSGLASRAISKTRFTDSYDLLFNHRFFNIGIYVARILLITRCSLCCDESYMDDDILVS